ncbi:hypothetical protein ACFX2I_000094 [Malus domestica]
MFAAQSNTSRLAAMNVRVSAALDSFEALTCAAVHEAMDSALAVVRHELALLRRDLGPWCRVKMSAVAYNSVLDALSKNGKFYETLSGSSDAFRSTYRKVVEKYKKEGISFPILDEVDVSHEKDSDVNIAKLRATVNGVPSDFDVKYYQLPQSRQDEMLAHLCLKFRTDVEELQQQEPLDSHSKAIRSSISHYLFYSLVDMVYLFHGVSNDTLFQLVSEMKAEYFPPKEDVISEMKAAYTEPYREKLLPDLHPTVKHVISVSLITIKGFNLGIIRLILVLVTFVITGQLS